MDRILEQSGSRSLISHLSMVELESVLAIKTRRRFHADIARQRILVAPPVHERHFHSARRLLIQYGVPEGLRTLDALQLAIALDLRQLGQVEVLVAADQRLCHVASMAGCSAVNPEKPGPVLA